MAPTTAWRVSEKRRNVQDSLEELDRVVTALAHASRRHILLVIRFRGGEMTAGEIAQRFSCTWPTTSRHLRVLERAGLLSHEKRGRERLYRLNGQKLDVVREWLGWLEEEAGSAHGKKSSESM